MRKTKKHFRKGVKMEIIRINKLFWLSFFCDKNFLEALKIASEATLKTGRETSFNIGIDYKGDIQISEISLGNYFDTSGKLSSNKIIFEFPIYSDLKTSVLDIHFHPDEPHSILPSSNDLSILFLKNINSQPLYPFIGIGSVDSKNNIPLLLIKKKYSLADPQFYNDKLPKDLDHIEQKEIIKILKSTGFEANLFNFTNLPKRGLQFNKKQEKNLAPFTAKIIIPEVDK